MQVAILEADPDGDIPDQRAIAAGLLTGLRLLAAAGPLVLAIDDVQWVDDDSARVLAFALRRLVGEPILVVVARRPGRVPHALFALDRAVPEERLVRLPLDGLEIGELYRLLVERLELRPARPVLARIHATTAGNPFYALEIGRALARRGGHVDPGGHLPVPDTLGAVLDEHLADLSASAAEALLIIAALAHATSGLVAAAGQPAEAVAELVAADLVQLDGERVRVSHPLFASVHYERVAPSRRRKVHRRLADLVTDPIERAAHLAFGAEGPDAAVAHAVGTAARQAAERGAPDAALELAELARHLVPRVLEQERTALALDASDYAFAAGDTGRARRLLEELLTRATARVRTEVLLRIAMLATYDGSVRQASDFAQQALAERIDDPALTIIIHRRLALAHLLLLEPAVAERHAHAAVVLAERAGDRTSLARALASLAHLRAVRGGEDASALLEKALTLEDAPGVASIDHSPTAIAGMLLMYAGALDDARVHLQASLERTMRRGGDPLSTGLLFAFSELESRAGRFHEAAALAQRGLDATEQTGQVTERGVLLYVKALADAHLGRERSARSAVAEGLSIANAPSTGWPKSSITGSWERRARSRQCRRSAGSVRAGGCCPPRVRAFAGGGSRTP